MPQTPLPNLGVNYEYTLGIDDWKNGFDSGMVILDAYAQGFVIDARIAEPAGPAVGDSYLLGPDTGVISGANWGTDTGAVLDSLAIYTNVPGQPDASPWFYIAPREGFSVYDRTLNRFWTYIGTEWIPGGHQRRLEKLEIGATYTSEREDSGRTLTLSNGAAPVVLTIDTFANVALPVGVFYDVVYVGTGFLEITGGAGVAIRAPGYDETAPATGARFTLEQWDRVRLWHLANDVWILVELGRIGTVQAETGATFEPDMRNRDGTVLINNAANTLNIPDEATVPYPIGTTLHFVNQNAAAITVTDDVAVGYATGSQNLVVAGIAANAHAKIRKVASDSWFVLFNQALPT